MSNLRIGIIGVGHLGRIHTKLWKEREDIELVGVFDLDSMRAMAIAEEFSTKSFGELNDLLDSVDAVSLVTSTSSHAPIALQTLERGIHCFIEKPITARYEEALPLITLADSKGLVLQVGHVERFNPALLAFQHSLGSARPEPMFIESHRMALFSPRATDVAVILDLMIHDIDLTLHLVGFPVTEVRASGVAVVSDTIDIANARLEFANGCVANLTSSRISQRPMRKMRLFQQDSYVSLDFAKPSAELFRIVDGNPTGLGTNLLGPINTGTRNRSVVYEQPPLPTVNAIAQELEEFVGAIRTGEAPPVTGHEAAEALRIAELIISAIDKKPSLQRSDTVSAVQSS